MTATAGRKRGRIEVLDLLRGIALIAMAVYHFTWDLEFFGYIARGTANSGGWRLFARGIASSFLFLVGLSLVLAHLRGIRWQPFLTRLAQIAAGATAITVATLLFTPGSFVFFGILHQIAVGSLIGLAFVRRSTWLAVAAGILVIALPNLYTTAAMNPRYLAWIGFAAQEPMSNDIVPIFPWTGIILLGIGCGLWLARNEGWLKLKMLNPAILSTPLTAPLRFIGSHSLAFYLIHQPVNIAVIAAWSYVMPPDLTGVFRQECIAACTAQQPEQICESYCGCVETELSDAGLMEPYLANRLTEDQTGDFQDKISMCTMRTLP
ncbi:Uncharacterized membrane protein [Aureimonas altamirensis DSM 21988]|uniref:Uncharacterized membrane protein n=1 Tax=Aureimonas altamirensis DSM 21988 TaxID=1121026 RepID=A0ABY1I6W7_9HYPH|nr:heparan-alpha-glucosaminide N-acetyltransferase [Aureimonas altamirensis]SHI71123.1 Uncharacterized membrane protein [Aureimonas altamirensis DSM 21988]